MGVGVGVGVGAPPPPKKALIFLTLAPGCERDRGSFISESNTYCTEQHVASPNRMLDFGTNHPSDRQALKRFVAHNLEVQAEVPEGRFGRHLLRCDWELALS